MKTPWECIGIRILQASGETVRPLEEIVKLALDPLWVESIESLYGKEETERRLGDAEKFHNLHAVLRTGGYFLFEAEDVIPDHWAELMQDVATELPPLPFPRTWFEIHDPEWSLAAMLDVDGKPSRMLGFAVIELEQCARWRVMLPMIDLEMERQLQADGRDNDKDLFIQAMPVREWDILIQDGQLHMMVGDDDEANMEKLPDLWKALWQQVFFLLPEYLCQMVHVIGSHSAPVAVARPRRREFQRKFGVAHPSLYWVNLGATGEHPEASGDRTYYHRWMVRGHYRLNENGPYVVPSKGQCSWVRPYIKGPEGAPWKGRPVHVAVGGE